LSRRAAGRAAGGLQTLVFVFRVIEMVIGGGVDGVVGGAADVAVISMVEARPEAVPGNHQLGPAAAQLVHHQLAQLVVVED